MAESGKSSKSSGRLRQTSSDSERLRRRNSCLCQERRCISRPAKKGPKVRDGFVRKEVVREVAKISWHRPGARKRHGKPRPLGPIKKKQTNIGAGGSGAFETTGLAVAGYYLGAMGKAAVKEMFLETLGQFAIRMVMEETPDGEESDIVVAYELDLLFSISPLQFHHCPVEYGRLGWSLDGRTWRRKISDIVDYHLKSGRSISDENPEAVLRVPAERPPWLLRDADVLAGEKVLGTGNFGVVLLGKLKMGGTGSEQEQEVVVKRTKAVITENERAAIYREACMMLDNQQTHLVLCYGLAIDTLPYQIIMEICGKGSLDSYLQKLKKAGTEVTLERRLGWCAQAADACAFLESNKVLHRDIAARNALLKGQTEVLKIADMGMAQKANAQGEYHEKGKNVVPVRWAAPEVLDKAIFSHASDAWALGVLFWEIFHDAEKPWGSAKPMEVVVFTRRGHRLTYRDEVGAPAELKATTAQMFLTEPSQRPSLQTVAGTLVSHLPKESTTTTTSTDMEDTDL